MEEPKITKEQLIEHIFQVGMTNGKAVYEKAHKVPIPGPEDYRLILLYFFGRASRDYNAIYCLWNRGFGAECWTVGRPLIEILLQSWYLLQKPAERAPLFFQHAKVMRFQTVQNARKLLEEGKTSAPPDWLDPSTPTIEAMRREYDAHKDKFRKRGGKLWSNWWCGNLSNLADQARAADQKYGQFLFDQYNLEYRIDSAYAHSSEIAMATYIYQDNDGYHIRLPEPNSEPRLPLHICQRLILMCIFMNGAYGLGMEKQLTTEWDLIKEAFQQSLFRRQA